MDDRNYAAQEAPRHWEREKMQAIAQARAAHQMAEVGGSLLADSGNRRSGMATAGDLFARANKIASITGDLADRIGGPVSEPECGSKAERDPMADLLTALAAIESALIRTEANVVRALQSL